jgi:hypothetical protein
VKWLVTDTVRERGWPQLRIISIAPLIAGAVQRLLADGSLGELHENAVQTASM